MGRRPKSNAEIEAIKVQILDATLQLISKDGYQGFSIRKLGPKLGIAPKTVYNYFKSKEEIYLYVLTRGFETFYDELCRSIRLKKDPFKKLEALVGAYVRFGFEQSNYYDIMFTWHVPKYKDFIGTSLEPVAYGELQAALKSLDLFIQIMNEIEAEYGRINKNDARINVIQLFVGMHGIVAFKNNTILDYVHENSATIIDTLLNGILAPFRPVKN
jgi:AcrR family transcriptional regulator